VAPILKRLRCAIYTRKSSEEGLEQAFNSLAAQREACIAFIESQRHEGWRTLEAHYDDGGYSGATLERPALKRLLADIAAGKLDCVVIYKLDRLTRALTDFGKMVEAFDARGIALVSVTQQFNTTSSMGRLTLNVLLSFAQFEREVTAERIRDKFAASKRKGLWMGGRVPLGYDLKERQLRVNPAEAKLVRNLYERYLALGCVSKLHAELNAQGMVSKQRLSRRGLASGGVPYSRGALYELLKNRLYLGEITYRGAVYPGQHKPIVERGLWERVQQQLARGRTARREGTHARVPSLLLGLVYNNRGERYTPTHSSKRAKRYRYYVLQAASPQQAISAPLGRICALDLEALVLQRLLAWLSAPLMLLDALSHPSDDTALAQTLLAAASARCRAWPTLTSAQLRECVRAVVVKVTIDPGKIIIGLSKSAVRAWLLAAADHAFCEAEDDRIELAQAHQWLEQLLRGEASSLRMIAAAVGKSERYVSKAIRAAFLAPDLVEALLEGRAPPGLRLAQLMKDLPFDWNEQRRLFAFVPAVPNRHLCPEQSS
jgi:DNA invertase Pin-like site-specific DNA recombinase